MSKNNKKMPVLLGLALWEAYRFYKGKGIFNKIRFKSQHEAIGNYVGTHYPNAFYSDVVETDDGWSCVINNNGTKIMLNMTKANDGTVVFWEKSM